MLIKLAMAVNYTAGGQTGGWDTTTNLQTWASSQSFLVGDNLIFLYAPNHDLLEVSKTDYDSCQASNPIQSYSGGTTTIPLSSPGKKYFICGTLGHCSQGMKVEIDTLAGSASAAASPSANPPASLVTPLVPTPAPESATSSETPASETTSRYCLLHHHLTLHWVILHHPLSFLQLNPLDHFGVGLQLNHLPHQLTKTVSL
ncbi:hypothetical protein CIPAW_04G118500 [Carya illinoinensis]|uniref:Phytocyanin domain-containing protein n=2 Tax=Carya illinoinensis TaxID=32201 RepID=A0A8T1QSA8_CARIL|nr:hypothetical protein CIPAW_04G118500 [Carya illinoinensis]